jgi:ribonuclease HI
VVWNGIKPGIYESWNECQQNIKGYPDAKYMSFATKLEAEAEAAFNGNNHGYTNKQTAMAIKLEGLKNGRPKPVYPALAVDAACNTATGDMEYRGVDAKTGREFFRQGSYFDGANNVGEFLGILHGFALLKQKGRNLPIIHRLKNSHELGSTETGQYQTKKNWS